MKFFTILVVLHCIKNAIQESSGGESLLRMARSSVVDCYEDELQTKKIEVTEAGFHDILNGKRDAVRNAKCIRYCIMKKHNMLSPDNTLDEKEVVTFFVYLLNNIIEVQYLQRVIGKCNEEIFGELDRCERSHKATMCILKGLRDGGLNDI